MAEKGLVLGGTCNQRRSGLETSFLLLRHCFFSLVSPHHSKQTSSSLFLSLASCYLTDNQLSFTPLSTCYFTARLHQFVPIHLRHNDCRPPFTPQRLPSNDPSTAPSKAFFPIIALSFGCSAASPRFAPCAVIFARSLLPDISRRCATIAPHLPPFPLLAFAHVSRLYLTSLHASCYYLCHLSRRYLPSLRALCYYLRSLLPSLAPFSFLVL